jgi:precorrin-6Y C5,15-methyltransferase (decarboxylating)
MNKVSVIGLGMSRRDLTDLHLSIIRQSDVIIGGKRHLAFFSDFFGKKIEINGNLKDIVSYIKDHQAHEKITVVASGDPLFYGIGGYLVKKLAADKIEVYPNVSGVAVAFARLNESWQDAQLISLHGRELTDLHLEQIKHCRKAAVLTDDTRTPDWLWRELEKNKITGFTFCVLEKLGEKDERIYWFEGDDIKGKTFLYPNILILLKKENPPDSVLSSPGIHLGMPEDCFHHEKGLITKPEVRAVTLSKLNLKTHHVFWDLGAGSGSISIEASFFIKTGQIVAVEKNANRIKDIERNKQKFNVNILDIVQRDLPDGLETLPKPDRVLIGGGGKNLPELVRRSALVMEKGGVIVVNTVLLASTISVLETLDKLKFKTDMVQIQVSHGHKMPWSLMLKSQNPVFIIFGEKI